MEIYIKRTKDSRTAHEIAKKLPEFFDAGGLKSIEEDSKHHILYGAYIDDEMIGFCTYKEINSDTIEMSWLGILPEKQGVGIGSRLVVESLNELNSQYKVCEVKTLSEIDPYEPYKRTRAFYKNLNFIPIETVSPYPGWGDNPCQIFVKFLRD